MWRKRDNDLNRTRLRGLAIPWIEMDKDKMFDTIKNGHRFGSGWTMDKKGIVMDSLDKVNRTKLSTGVDLEFRDIL